MAGLGGALLAGFRGTATPEQFQFVQSLPILLLAVVGGIGAVGGALMGGLSLSLALPFISDTFPRLKNIVLLAPGLIGISLGRNPNGAVNETPRAIRELRDERAAARARPPEPEPATLGLEQPFSSADRRKLDDELGIDEGEVELVGSTRA
jgi:branched-chain amino acid transport system permease protein